MHTHVYTIVIGTHFALSTSLPWPSSLVPHTGAPGALQSLVLLLIARRSVFHPENAVAADDERNAKIQCDALGGIECNTDARAHAQYDGDNGNNGKGFHLIFEIIYATAVSDKCLTKSELAG